MSLVFVARGRFFFQIYPWPFSATQFPRACPVFPRSFLWGSRVAELRLFMSVQQMSTFCVSGALPKDRDYTVLWRSELYTQLITAVRRAKCREPAGCAQSAEDCEGNLGKVQRGGHISNGLRRKGWHSMNSLNSGKWKKQHVNVRRLARKRAVGVEKA